MRKIIVAAAIAFGFALAVAAPAGAAGNFAIYMTSWPVSPCC
jgi:hypothetical protein